MRVLVGTAGLLFWLQAVEFTGIEDDEPKVGLTGCILCILDCKSDI
jgi:hypothetical protein